MVMMNCTYCCRLFESFVCLCGGRKSFDGSEGHCFVLWQVILFPVKFMLQVVLYCSVTHCSVLHCCMLFSPVLHTALVLQCLYISIPGTILCTQSCRRWWRFGPFLHQVWNKNHHLLQLSLCINCICNYIMWNNPYQKSARHGLF